MTMIQKARANRLEILAARARQQLHHRRPALQVLRAAAPQEDITNLFAFDDMIADNQPVARAA